MKVNSRYQELVVREKTVMSKLNNPFVSRLLLTYHDEKSIYILIDLSLGGELYNLMKKKYLLKVEKEDTSLSCFSPDECKVINLLK